MVVLFARQLGHEATCAGGGRGAIGILGRASADLVILDAEMDGISGLDLLGLIKGRSATRDVPVVMHSTHDPGVRDYRVAIARMGPHAPDPPPTA